MSLQPLQPSVRPIIRPGRGAWMRTDEAKVAHYFNDSGRSACHLWMTTTRDRADVHFPKCLACIDALHAEIDR